MKKITLRELTQGAVIAALYVALTLIPGLSSIAFGARASEALSILPFFTRSAIGGLFVGCLTANILSGAHIVDIILGSLATLLAAYLSHLLKHNRYLSLIPPVIVNAVVVGSYLPFLYGTNNAIPISIGLVGLGELIVCYGIGLPLSFLLDKYKNRLFENIS